MENKFLELVSSPLMNLDHTYRYSGTKLVEAESLSQHIVDTIMLGIKIIDKINHLAGENIVSTKEYVMKAVYHDLEEVITGDIPRPLKYYNDATRDSLKDVADLVAKEFFTEQFSELNPHYEYWNLAKEGREGYILKIVDTLVVANKVIKEVSLLHNFYMLRVAHEVSRYLTEQYDYMVSRRVSGNLIFSDVRVNNYLIDVIEGALSSMEKIIEDNRDCMESLNIYGQSMI